MWQQAGRCGGSPEFRLRAGAATRAAAAARIYQRNGHAKTGYPVHSTTGTDHAGSGSPGACFTCPDSTRPESAPASPGQTAAPQSAARPPANKTVALRQQDGSLNNPDASAPGVRARLTIQRGGRIGKEFVIINDESLIGRWDADGGIFPDVDLDQDDPEAKISRRHARVLIQSDQFFIEDLGSTNGTFVNRGQRLLPGNRHPLNQGDEIIVGKTFLKFVLT